MSMLRIIPWPGALAALKEKMEKPIGVLIFPFLCFLVKNDTGQAIPATMHSSPLNPVQIILYSIKVVFFNQVFGNKGKKSNIDGRQMIDR